jgi:hypothetical protein
MDLKTACEILKIDINELSIITKKQIRKQYHLMALKHHPDKNENKAGSTYQFQQIHEAYEYLINDFIYDDEDVYSSDLETETAPHSETDYIYLVAKFISGVVKDISTETLTNIMKNILFGCKNISLQLFDELDKEKAFEIYTFICKYKHILCITNSIIKQVEQILKNKYKDNKVFILNPSLNDLLLNNIYKLVIDNEKYLVPLWHNELYFDNDVIVLCIPELDKNISIDDNNIIVELNISWNFVKTEKNISFLLGKKEFIIPIETLFIKTSQVYTFANQGISQIIDNDIYNTYNKGDIIVKIYLFDE